MNPIDLAIRHICSRIPRELITAAFKPDYVFGRYDAVTPEFLIRKEVIEGIVLQDLNIIGGQQVDIDLSNILPKNIEGAMVFTVPLKLTHGRHISRIVSITNMPNTTVGPSGNALEDAAMKALNSTGTFQSTGTTNAELVAPNVIAVYEWVTGSLYVKCMLNYDDQLNGLNQAFYREFAMLCQRATEFTIYNRMSIILGSGSANGGSPNSFLRQRLDEMANSAELYDEMIKSKWHKIPILADHRQHMEHIQMILG